MAALEGELSEEFDPQEINSYVNQPDEIGYPDLNTGNSIDLHSILSGYKNQVTGINFGSENKNKPSAQTIEQEQQQQQHSKNPLESIIQDD